METEVVNISSVVQTPSTRDSQTNFRPKASVSESTIPIGDGGSLLGSESLSGTVATDEPMACELHRKASVSENAISLTDELVTKEKTHFPPLDDIKMLRDEKEKEFVTPSSVMSKTKRLEQRWNLLKPVVPPLFVSQYISETDEPIDDCITSASTVPVISQNDSSEEPYRPGKGYSITKGFRHSLDKASKQPVTKEKKRRRVWSKGYEMSSESDGPYKFDREHSSKSEQLKRKRKSDKDPYSLGRTLRTHRKSKNELRKSVPIHFYTSPDPDTFSSGSHKRDHNYRKVSCLGPATERMNTVRREVGLDVDTHSESDVSWFGPRKKKHPWKESPKQTYLRKRPVKKTSMPKKDSRDVRENWLLEESIPDDQFLPASEPQCQDRSFLATGTFRRDNRNISDSFHPTLSNDQRNYPQLIRSVSNVTSGQSFLQVSSRNEVNLQFQAMCTSTNEDYNILVDFGLPEDPTYQDIHHQSFSENLPHSKQPNRNNASFVHASQVDTETQTERIGENPVKSTQTERIQECLTKGTQTERIIRESSTIERETVGRHRETQAEGRRDSSVEENSPREYRSAGGFRRNMEERQRQKGFVPLVHSTLLRDIVNRECDKPSVFERRKSCSDDEVSPFRSDTTSSCDNESPLSPIRNSNTTSSNVGRHHLSNSDLMKSVEEKITNLSKKYVSTIKYNSQKICAKLAIYQNKVADLLVEMDTEVICSLNPTTSLQDYLRECRNQRLLTAKKMKLLEEAVAEFNYVEDSHEWRLLELQEKAKSKYNREVNKVLKEAFRTVEKDTLQELKQHLLSVTRKYFARF